MEKRKRERQAFKKADWFSMEASKLPLDRQTAAYVRERGVSAREKEWQSPECPGKQAQILLSIWREKINRRKRECYTFLSNSEEWAD